MIQKSIGRVGDLDELSLNHLKGSFCTFLNYLSVPLHEVSNCDNVILRTMFY